MLDDLDRANLGHRARRSFLVWIVLTLGSLAISSTLTGCSAWTISASEHDPAVTHFGYAGSPLAATIVPASQSRVALSAFFGMTIHHLVATPSWPLATAPFPAFPIHTFRLWDVVNWSTLEPAEGQYDWTTMDQTIAIAKENGVSDFIFTLGDEPTWALASACQPVGVVCNAPNMQSFDDFIAHVVQRYCGVVQYYETWNEPNLSWSGTNAQLLGVASDLYRIAKDPANCGCSKGVCVPGGGLNPNEVLLPSINSINAANLTWLDKYLATSGTDYPYADIVAFHGYTSAPPEAVVQQVAQLRNILAKYGLSSLPLWDTEASWGESNLNDQEQEASWLMRFHIAQAATGVSRFVWYAYDNCTWGTLWAPSLCSASSEQSLGPRLPGRAYATLENWMLGVTLTHCDEYQDGLWACELQGSGGYEGWILWESVGSGDLSVPIPNPLGLTQYRDWQNNVRALSQEIAVNQMPVLVEN